MSHASAEALSAWLLSLKGQVGTFTYQPRQSTESTIANKALDAPAYAYQSTIVTSGWTASAPTGLRVGQFFKLGTQLLRITEAAANATADGKATISFEPELRRDFNTGSLNFRTPTGLFRLATADGASYTLDPDKLPDFGTIQAREVI